MYLSVKDAARQLGIAERTVRGLANQYDWFGSPLGLEDGDYRPWVFSSEDVERMQKTPRPGVGRPRKPICEVATMVSKAVDTVAIS